MDLPTSPTYKVRANSSRVLKVDIYPIGKQDSVVVRTHRSRNFSDSEAPSLRRPSVLTLLFIIVCLILVELQLVIYMKDRSTVHLVSTTTSSSIESADCTYSWSDLRCSAGCCLRTYERKGAPLAICEPCASGASQAVIPASMIASSKSSSFQKQSSGNLDHHRDAVSLHDTYAMSDRVEEREWKELRKQTEAREDGMMMLRGEREDGGASRIEQEQALRDAQRAFNLEGSVASQDGTTNNKTVTD